MRNAVLIPPFFDFLSFISTWLIDILLVRSITLLFLKLAEISNLFVSVYNTCPYTQQEKKNGSHHCTSCPNPGIMSHCHSKKTAIQHSAKAIKPPRDTPPWIYLANTVQYGKREVVGMAILQDITPAEPLSLQVSRRQRKVRQHGDTGTRRETSRPCPLRWGKMARGIRFVLTQSSSD
jgi:hypothetical protein